MDRNEYTVAATGATGTLTGNGQVDGFASIGGDARGVGIVFTYDAASGRYYNGAYGYLDQTTYTASSSSNDVTNISIFGTSNLAQANQYKANPYAMLQVDAAGYLGSATVVTLPGAAAAAQATPNSIAAMGQSFVGKAWNNEGCWVLASTISAEAGASLPLDSSLVGVTGHNNGEWFVAFDGTWQSGDWQSMVKAGEMIVVGNPGGGGHITTVVSGSGGTAMVVDNITYVDSTGAIVNLANDGSPNDIIIAAPHAASQEFAGVSSSTVKIYELDTPVVSALVANDQLATAGRQTLSQLFSAADPAGKAVVLYQVYDTASGDSFTVNGVAETAHSAASAITVGDLSTVCLVAGAAACTDTLELRASNGSFWGDWQGLTVQVTATTSPTTTTTTTTTTTPTTTTTTTTTKGHGPSVAHHTANQVWASGHVVSFALPANTFTDGDGQALAYTAYQLAGPSVVSWLRFHPAGETFSGVVPWLAAGTATIEVVARDAAGLSASETFTVTFGQGSVGLAGVVAAAAPVHGAELLHG